LKIIDRSLYGLICNLDLIILAYENLKSKPGNMTPGIVPETFDGISIDVLKEIQEELRTEKFQFKPSRSVSIRKPQGGIRKLLIAPPRDKLVQEMLKIVLNTIFEPRFQDVSHGFRPKKSCHTALKYVNQKFQSST
jgi:retron-type reverse transcriptase